MWSIKCQNSEECKHSFPSNASFCLTNSRKSPKIHGAVLHKNSNSSHFKGCNLEIHEIHGIYE